MVQIIYKNT